MNVIIVVFHLSFNKTTHKWFPWHKSTFVLQERLRELNGCALLCNKPFHLVSTHINNSHFFSVFGIKVEMSYIEY